MDRRQREELDRWITGNYGEDQPGRLEEEIGPVPRGERRSSMRRTTTSDEIREMAWAGKIVGYVGLLAILVLALGALGVVAALVAKGVMVAWAWVL